TFEPILSQIAVINDLTLLKISTKFFQSFCAPDEIFSHIFEPPPLVKYTLISSQYFMIRATAAPMATTVIPIGPVIVANAVPTNGANCMIVPRANNNGPIAAAAAPTYTI